MESFNIYEKISNYLGFELSQIIRKGYYGCVFGGAVRDSIANKEIHDVDILCLSDTCKNIIISLEKNGYVFDDDLVKKNMYSMYKDIKIINEPLTYYKDNKVVQLIRPVNKDSVGFVGLESGYKYVLKQVDLSCCGVYFDGEGLKESINCAIEHCRMNIMKRMSTEMNKPTRFYQRIDKLKKRGWIYYDDLSDDKKYAIDLNIDRKIKLQNILEY